MSNPGAISYDEVPYESQAFHETHPDHIAALARLQGVETPPLPTARILELGCASGGNLIPTAVAWPESRCVGIDLSARQIADGQAAVDRLKLRNVELRAASVTDLGPELGTFDYIICHGVFSWVPPEVREAILALCKRHLAPSGAAMVSFNTYPGWHALQMIREMMLAHVDGITDPEQKIARAREFMKAIPEGLAEPNAPYGQILKREIEQILPKSDSYILHEHLEEYNQPYYYRDFLALVKPHGLDHLCDARLRTAPEAMTPAQRTVLDKLAGADFRRREQYLDFLHNRTFRRAILVHAGTTFKELPDAEHLSGVRAMAAAGPVQPVVDVHSDHPEEFRTPNGQRRLSTNNPVMKAAFVVLCQNWPRSLPIPELLARSLELLDQPPDPSRAAAFDRDPGAFASAILSCFANGLVEVVSHEPPFATVLGERPKASPWAVLQAQQGAERVTNLRHRMVELSAFERTVVKRLDGTRDHAGLTDALVGAVLEGEFPITRDGQPLRDTIEIRQILERSLDPCLQRLGNSGILMA